MGSRDDGFIDQERADAAMLHLLARSGHPSAEPPPPALVTRTMRQLPGVPPAAAARRYAHGRRLRLAVLVVVLVVLALIALDGLVSMLGGAHGLLFLGDGSGGLSRVFLMLFLMAKPLVRLVGTLGLSTLLAGVLGAAIGGWLWWRLLLPAPASVYVESQP